MTKTKEQGYDGSQKTDQLVGQLLVNEAPLELEQDLDYKTLGLQH